jgi:DNA-binding beta-propeller fold protein YncE
MSYRKGLLVAGSVIAMAGFFTFEPLLVSPSQAQMFFGKVGPANGTPDGNGVPCFGFLDGGGQCLTNQNATSTTDHPVRLEGKVGQSRSRSGAVQFARHARDLIYIATPGGSSDDPNSTVKTGEGIIVLDARAGYSFVKRIPIQNLPASIEPAEASAMMADPVTNMLYISTRGHLIAMDLATDKIVWDNTYEKGTCCERGQITPDGLTLEVGSNLKDFHRVIDAKTGVVKGIIQTPKSMFNHNTGMSADGKTVFAAPNGLTMTVADMATMKATHTITFDDHIRVFVINHDASRVYANLNNLLGFEIADARSGKIIKRVEAPAEMWKAKWADPNLHFYGHGAPQHGLALTPDESEIWVPDAINNQMLIYDNEGQDNWKLAPAKTIKTEHPSNWITMGLDGKIALSSSGDVIDVKSHRVIAPLKDEHGNLIHSEKFLELAFDPNGHLLRAENQFAQGDPAAVEARRVAMEAGSGGKSRN